jgi:hypothetical protein
MHGMRCLAILVACGGLATVAYARPREVFQAKALVCNQQFPPGNPKTAMNRARCVNDALALLLPTVPNADLLKVLMASRLAIIEQYAAGKITQAQANAAIAQKVSQLVTEEQRRELTRRSVGAAERAAAAQAQAAAAQQRAADADEDTASAAQFGTIMSIMRAFSR